MIATRARGSHQWRPRTGPVLLLLLLAMASMTALMVRADDDPGAPMPGVLSLSDDSFDAVVGKGKAALVEFYAPWCGHCKSMAAEYAKLGAALEASASAKEKLVIAKVDGTQSPALASRFQVQGYPTILFFPPTETAKPDSYEKGRSAEEFVAYLSERIPGLDLSIPKEPVYVEELTKETYQERILDAPATHAFVLVYAPWCGHCKKVKPIFNELARVFAREPRVLIAQINADDPKNSDLPALADVKGYPTIFFYPLGQRDEEPIKYEGGRDLESFVEFLNTNCHTMRTTDGDVDERYGLQDELTNAVNDMIRRAGDEAALREHFEKFVEAAKGTRGESVQYYLKIAQRVLEDRSTKFIESELARIEKILSKHGSGAMSGARRDGMLRRRNILSAVQARRMAFTVNERPHGEEN